MSRFTYVITRILFSLLVFLLLSSLWIYLYDLYLYDLYPYNELIANGITLITFALLLLISFFAGKKLLFWVKQQDNLHKAFNISLITIATIIIILIGNNSLKLGFNQNPVIIRHTDNFAEIGLEEIKLDHFLTHSEHFTEGTAIPWGNYSGIIQPNTQIASAKHIPSGTYLASGKYLITVPEFNLPPPEASATAIIPSNFFKDSVYLKDIDKTLNQALDSAGYFEKSYYGIKDGFTIVTRLEQINSDGTPKKGSERWNTEQTPLNLFEKFSLGEYFKALFTANPGYYRVIVFVISPHPFSQGENKLSSEEAEDWLRAGLNKLPESIAEKSYSSKYISTALIYEFEKANTSEAKKIDQKTPSSLQGTDHLVKAGIWTKLEK